MAWQTSIVRDISHHNTIGNYTAFRSNAESVQIKITESTDFIDNAAAHHKDGCEGMRRAPYHFARPISIPQQISHFLSRKAFLGQWERPDMLDCEFSGITGAFIRAIKDEYRRQSGIRKVQIYVGLHDLITTCPPSQWWDEDVYIQAARYRKIGPPNDPDAWRTHLGFDHPGLSTYQWDNNTPFYPNGPTGDVSFDRVLVTSKVGVKDVNLSDATDWESPGDPNYSEHRTIQEIMGASYYFSSDANKNAAEARKGVEALTNQVAELTSLVKSMQSGFSLVPTGTITVTPKTNE